MLDKNLVASAFKRVKLDLDAYDSASDLKLRVFFDRLEPQDLPIIEEVLHSSVNTTVDDLLSDLEIKRNELKPTLEKLAQIDLLKVEGDNITISKDVRKLMEVYFERTEEGFCPDIHFAFEILRALPVQLIAVWYALPKTSTNLNEALIEKFFQTPDLYKRHLDSTKFEDELTHKIFKKVIRNSFVYVEEIQKEFDLTSEALHEIVLHLELNFIAYLTYEEKEGKLVGKLSMLREYTAYLTQVEAGSHMTACDRALQALREGPFSFLRDLDAFVAEATKKHFDDDLTPENIQIMANQLGIKLSEDNLSVYEAYFEKLKNRALKLRLLEIGDGELILGSSYEKWNKLSEEDRAFCYLRHPALKPIADEKSVRAAEKSIATVIGKGWVKFDEFIARAFIPLRPEIEVRLKGRGLKSHYELPEYSESEKELVRFVIFQSLAESGFVEVCEGDFKLLPFGELVFGESDE